MLANCETVIGENGRPQALFDLSDLQTAAVAHALTHYRRVRFAASAIETEPAVRALRELDSVCEQADRLARTAAHSVFRVDVAAVDAMSEAAALYLRRDTESYQPPEERERLALLAPLPGEFDELSARLRGAERELASASN